MKGKIARAIAVAALAGTVTVCTQSLASAGLGDGARQYAVNGLGNSGLVSPNGLGNSGAHINKRGLSPLPFGRTTAIPVTKLLLILRIIN